MFVADHFCDCAGSDWNSELATSQPPRPRARKNKTRPLLAKRRAHHLDMPKPIARLIKQLKPAALSSIGAL
ncbi:MAG TPA: hypothetical protein VII49_11805 [Rhizomicrobium sp.]